MSTAGDQRPAEPPTIDKWHEVGVHELLGIEGFEIDDGEVRAAIELGDEHLNPSGLTHGGVIFLLVDSAIAAAVMLTLGDDEWMATQSSTIDFLRPATGRITARARVDERAPMAAYGGGEAINEDGRVIAKTSAVWAIRSE